MTGLLQCLSHCGVSLNTGDGELRDINKVMGPARGALPSPIPTSSSTLITPCALMMTMMTTWCHHTVTMTMLTFEPKTTTPIFASGKMVVMDVKSEDDSRLGSCNSLCRLVFVGHKAARCFDRNVDCGS